MKTKIIQEDEKDFEEKIKFLKKSGQINFLCSLTYITPNYDVLSTLKELYDFAKDMNFKLFLIMWDTNALANPYFKKYLSYKVKDPEVFIQDKLKELKTLAKVVGFNDENLIIYKSSDLWKRLISFGEENIFQQFFLLLSRLPTKEFSYLRKSSHLFQISLDVFFSIYFSKLYPEDIDEGIDIIFSDYYKNKLYLATRQIMMEEGIIKNKPLILLMKTVPYIVYDERTPEWNMKLEEIRYILLHSQNKKDDFIKLLNYFNVDLTEDKIPREQIIERLSQELYKYLSEYREKFLKEDKGITESIINITKKQDAIRIGNVLRSRIFFDILTLANGSKTITQIAKELKKSVPTISLYTTKLKKFGFISIDERRKLKRNLKGVKINFDGCF